MNKKNIILKEALNAFANEGVKATTTQKIAQLSGVSEALVFKHFKSKQGLVDELIEKAKNRGEELIRELIKNEHPKIIIKTFLGMVLNIDRKDFMYILLLFQFKDLSFLTQWEYVKHFNELLLKVFHQMGCTDPTHECTSFWMHICGILTYKKYSSTYDTIKLYEKLLDKYQV